MLTTALVLAILASIIIPMGTYIDQNTFQRYSKWIYPASLVLAVVYFLGSTVFLVISFMTGVGLK